MKRLETRTDLSRHLTVLSEYRIKGSHLEELMMKSGRLRFGDPFSTGRKIE